MKENENYGQDLPFHVLVSFFDDEGFGGTPFGLLSVLLNEVCGGSSIFTFFIPVFRPILSDLFSYLTLSLLLLLLTLSTSFNRASLYSRCSSIAALI